MVGNNHMCAACGMYGILHHFIYLFIFREDATFVHWYLRVATVDG